MNGEKLELEAVFPSEYQIRTLYQQLRARNHTISHKSLPSYDCHKEFVTNHPYRAWFVILLNKIALGNVYIHHDNSIGLNCSDEISEAQIKKILSQITSEFQPLEAVPSVRLGKFFLNVASSNTLLIEKLKNLGLIESQRSFIYDI